jgi:hypothetical protein
VAGGVAVKWRVWIAQVNQTFVEVEADDREEAEEKARRKWKREWAAANVTYVQGPETKETP